MDRISVQLPGVLNSAEVKDILGKRRDAGIPAHRRGQQRRRKPCQRPRAAGLAHLLPPRANGIRQPTLLKREIIATGDQLVDATTTVTQDGPGVSVRLNSAGRRRDAAHHAGQPRPADGGRADREDAREDTSIERRGSRARCHQAGSDQRGHDPRRVQQPVQHHRPGPGRGARTGAADALRPAGRPAVRRQRACHRPVAGRRRTSRPACAR